ncbi:MAG TPA: glycosyltransferase family 2 protein, partial [Oligoflexia bacterium]|nr:glycosyltransferase family 2 protein [Oligoflexia bacterium]
MSEQPLPSVVVHIVTFNSSRTILPCLESALGQQGFELDANLLVAVTDNASIDDTSAIVLQHFGNRVQFTQNSVNLGFCAAHNHGINTALSGGARYVLLLNPDCRLAPDALAQLVSTLENDPRSGAACPKLLRANAGLEPVVPHVFDSSGMYITPQIRHFDRASQQLDYGQHDCEEYVFGASGAAILLKSHFIEDAALPPLSVGMPARLFDEAFFAYREDADLAWRALRLGWKCRYVPQAAAFHERVVLPENRKALPAELNAYSVRNRFLLQFNNFSFWTNLHCLPLMILRNILVILGALFVERSSLPGLRGAYCLLPQARRNRLWLAKRERICPAYAAKWFSSRPYSEPLLTRRAAAAKIQSLLIVIINYNSGSRLTECLKSLSPALRGMMPQIHA